MPDTLLTVADYTELRAAVAGTFTDTVVAEQYTETRTANGVTRTYSTRNTGAGLWADLQGNELMRAQQLNAEVTAEVRVDALRTIDVKDRLRVTNHETGVVRVGQVLFVFKPSREFIRRCLVKES